MSKKNIVILGTNKNAEFLESIIDKDKCNLLYYISVDNNLIHKKLNKYPIYSVDYLQKNNFDYIINMEENIIFKNGDLNKVIEYSYFKNLTVFKSPEFSLMYSNFKESQNYTGVITGISYTRSAINEDLLKEDFVNLSAPCQDLFYDFEMFKKALDKKESSIKYCIIGLTLYSFNYDLSLSDVNKERSLYYYPITNTTHNYNDKNNLRLFLEDFKRKEKEVFITDHQYLLFNKYADSYKKILSKTDNAIFDSTSLTLQELTNKINYIDKEFNKSYPNTVRENVNILEDYLQLLIDKNIKAIVFIPPISQFYKKYISNTSIKNFFSTIDKLNKKFDFKFLNFWDDVNLSDDYYTDGCHLNKYGSTVITEKIINYL